MEHCQKFHFTLSYSNFNAGRRKSSCTWLGQSDSMEASSSISSHLGITGHFVKVCLQVLHRDKTVIKEEKSVKLFTLLKFLLG